tara:strand:+ start:750 stop:1112 length:363 start_codon:yes stop_codon:yes gene_type:complete
MSECEKENRRAHRRIAMSREGRIHHFAGDAPARILDISAGGAGLQMEMRLPDGTEMTLEIDNIGLIPARIVRQMQEGVAVKFEFSAEKEQELIRRIAHLVARKRREAFHIVGDTPASPAS